MPQTSTISNSVGTMLKITKLSRNSIPFVPRSMARRAVLFSIVVQYGPTAAANLVLTATANIESPAALTDRQLIKMLYKERDQVERYFPDIVAESSRYADLIKLRNSWEKDDALYLLDQEMGNGSDP